jgi:hypothetical protein
MKVCAALWVGTKQGFSEIRFITDDMKEGEHLNDLLENTPAEIIEGSIERAERKQAWETATPDGPLELMGLSLDFSAEESTLTVRKMAQSGQAVS